jgi:starch phosphorylase
MTPPDLSALPARLSRLYELALDLSWTWSPARDLFRLLDYRLWQQTRHNPVLMLRQMDVEALDRAANDPEVLALYDRSVAAYDQLRPANGHGGNGHSGAGQPRTWWHSVVTANTTDVVAYFSAEFAVHQSLPIYAGGLGVLAGDHCKEASDLGIPLIGVGFMYPQGYFRQRVSSEGWQQEQYERIDWDNAPIQRAQTRDRKPCVVQVPLGDRTVLVQVWEVRLGRVRLVLLDTDVEPNQPWDRELTARLYGGGQDTRLQQEIVLGLGGVLALRALGLTPAVWHLNEGHAAFVILQRMRDLIAAGSSWETALVEVRRSTVFTTHTPVPAGHDAFPFHLVEQHLASSWGSMGSERDHFMALGTYDNGVGPQFNMTALAMRSAGAINAVSQLHGEVTREMFAPLWPDLAQDDRPVGAITNGVHAPTWIADELSRLFDRHMGAQWRERYDEPDFWTRLADIPDEELWATRETLRDALFQFMRERARERFAEEGGALRAVAGGAMFDPNALTIGFARRFTGYKRPDLIFRDVDRLARLVNDTRRPVQFVFAGKAHPADEAGKHHLQQIFRHALDARFGGRIAFVDDYDLHVAHRLVQGCDVWLNNPRKPLEASGTSGMKAAMNGVPHLSIGDGWWAEGYAGDNGWLIEGQTTSTDQGEVDAADAASLYDLLEQQVVPAFYERGPRNIPTRWLPVVRRAIATALPHFCTRRMLKDYIERAYAPAFKR